MECVTSVSSGVDVSVNISDLVGHGVKVQGKQYRIVGVTAGDHYADGGDTVFDVFDLSAYQFLELKNDGISGERIDQTYNADGVFKLRQGMNASGNTETIQTDATLHIRPDETFITDAPDNREHYRLTLQEYDYGN